MLDQTQQPTRDDAYELFTTLLVANQPAIMGFICSLLTWPSDAEDVLQKTCLVAWQKFDRFDASTEFSTWVCQIAFFEVKNFIRTRSRDRHVFSDEVLEALADEGPRESERLAEERNALSQCIKTLKPNECELLQRYYQRGMTAQQVSELFSCTASSVYKQIGRLRRRLLACITQRLHNGGAE